MDFIFAVGFLLWFAIEGLFKLCWLIVSLPFRLIKRVRDKKQADIRIAKQKLEEEQQEQQERRQVDAVFQALFKNIFNGSALPDKMIVDCAGVQLVYGADRVNVLTYEGNGLMPYVHRLESSSSEYYSSRVNQPRLLAEKINAAANGGYFLRDEVELITTDYTRPGAEYQDKCYTTHYKYVEMTKK